MTMLLKLKKSFYSFLFNTILPVSIARVVSMVTRVVTIVTRVTRVTISSTSSSGSYKNEKKIVKIIEMCQILFYKMVKSKVFLILFFFSKDNISFFFRENFLLNQFSEERKKSQ